MARRTSSAAKRSASAPRLDSDASRHNQKQGGEEQVSSPTGFDATHVCCHFVRHSVVGQTEQSHGGPIYAEASARKGTRSSLMSDPERRRHAPSSERCGGGRRPQPGRLLVRHRCTSDRLTAAPCGCGSLKVRNSGVSERRYGRPARARSDRGLLPLAEAMRQSAALVDTSENALSRTCALGWSTVAPDVWLWRCSDSRDVFFAVSEIAPPSPRTWQPSRGRPPSELGGESFS